MYFHWISCPLFESVVTVDVCLCFYVSIFLYVIYIFCHYIVFASRSGFVGYFVIFPPTFLFSFIFIFNNSWTYTYTRAQSISYATSSFVLDFWICVSTSHAHSFTHYADAIFIYLEIIFNVCVSISFRYVLYTHKRTLSYMLKPLAVCTCNSAIIARI